MISENEPYPHHHRTRFVWALLASVLLNLIGWIVLPLELSDRGARAPRETLIVSVTRIRIEHRTPAPARAAMPPVPAFQPLPKQTLQPLPVRTPRTEQPVIVAHVALPATHVPALPRHPRQAVPKEAPTPDEQTANLGPPPPAYLALPSGWSRQDFAFLGTTNTAEWLDWNRSKESSKWVPRVFLWRMKTEAAYMQRPSLRDAVERIISSLRDDATIYENRSQRVCDGKNDGWFLSYVKTEDDPPLHFDETVFMAGTKVFRAMYIRAVDQPEDSVTRDALNTLCSS